MTFTIQNMEYYLMVLVRISAFVMTAPFFSYNAIPIRIKVAISVFLTLVVAQVIPIVELPYTSVVGYATLALKEMVVGLVLGFMCSLCFYIVNFAGQLMDIEMGLSMATMFDPMSNMQITITGNIYNYFLMLTMVITNMHYYIIRAITDSFKYFNVGQEVFRSDGLKTLMVDFLGNYFMIALRIVLPVFCCMLMLNVVLGVLTRAAPQMNMFVIGIQLKLLAGMVVLVLLVQTFPTVFDFIFAAMKDVITQTIHVFSP